MNKISFWLSILRFLIFIIARFIIPITIVILILSGWLGAICLPMYVAQKLSDKLYIIWPAGIMFILICFSFLDDAYSSLAGFYQIKYYSIFPKHLVESNIKHPIRNLITSYIFNIYAFAVAYAYFSHIDPDKTFSTHKPLSIIDSIYFSVITAATIGYGDITPISDTAKIIVIIQTVLNLFYVIFLFSICSTHLKEKRLLIKLEATTQSPGSPSQH